MSFAVWTKKLVQNPKEIFEGWYGYLFPEPAWPVEIAVGETRRSELEKLDWSRLGHGFVGFWERRFSTWYSKPPRPKKEDVVQVHVYPSAWIVQSGQAIERLYKQYKAQYSEDPAEETHFFLVHEGRLFGKELCLSCPRRWWFVLKRCTWFSKDCTAQYCNLPRNAPPPDYEAFFGGNYFPSKECLPAHPFRTTPLTELQHPDSDIMQQSRKDSNARAKARSTKRLFRKIMCSECWPDFRPCGYGPSYCAGPVFASEVPRDPKKAILPWRMHVWLEASPQRPEEISPRSLPVPSLKRTRCGLTTIAPILTTESCLRSARSNRSGARLVLLRQQRKYMQRPRQAAITYAEWCRALKQKEIHTHAELERRYPETAAFNARIWMAWRWVNELPESNFKGGIRQNFLQIVVGTPRGPVIMQERTVARRHLRDAYDHCVLATILGEAFSKERKRADEKLRRIIERVSGIQEFRKTYGSAFAFVQKEMRQ